MGSSRTACSSLLFDSSANASTNSLLMLPCRRIIAAMGSGKGCIRFGCNPATSLVAGTSTTIWSGRFGIQPRLGILMASRRRCSPQAIDSIIGMASSPEGSTACSSAR